MVSQDFPEPTAKLGFGFAAKSTDSLNGLHHGVLHHVAGPDLGLVGTTHLRPRQHPQVRFIFGDDGRVRDIDRLRLLSFMFSPVGNQSYENSALREINSVKEPAESK